MSIKSHDCYFAALCHECHVQLDQGVKWLREERKHVWQTAHERTLLELWRRGWIKVNR